MRPLLNWVILIILRMQSTKKVFAYGPVNEGMDKGSIEKKDERIPYMARGGEIGARKPINDDVNAGDPMVMRGNNNNDVLDVEDHPLDEEVPKRPSHIALDKVEKMIKSKEDIYRVLKDECKLLH